MFGTDYPCMSLMRIEEYLVAIESYSRFDSEARAAIVRDNALKLLPRFKEGFRAKIEKIQRKEFPNG